MIRLFKVLFILGSLLVLFSCQPGGTGNEEAIIPVETTDVALGQIKQSLFYNGDINAEFEVKVFSKIPDRIEKYFVDEGDVVQRGDPIAKIVATTIEQAVRQAEAMKNNMDAEYARAQKLHREDAMSQQQFDAIEAQATQARAAYLSAKSQLGDATVRAPISGIIGKRYFEAGDMASPTVPVASVVQMNRVKIKLDATETDLGKLKVGQRAEVKVRSYPNRTFIGKIAKISPVLDPLTRMATVEVLLPNSDRQLKPGMYATVEVITGILEDVLVVPRYVVIESTTLKTVDGKEQVGKNYFVYVVNDSSKAEQRLLEVDYVNHQNVAVRSGIALGEQLVISGQNNLRDGMTVLVVTDEEGQ
jgi:RND family efflux transporter MFP subunit